MGENYRNYEERFAGVKVYGLRNIATSAKAQLIIDPQSNEPVSYAELERVLLTRSAAIEVFDVNVSNRSGICFITQFLHTTDFAGNEVIAVVGGINQVTAVSLTQDGRIPMMVEPA